MLEFASLVILKCPGRIVLEKCGIFSELRCGNLSNMWALFVIKRFETDQNMWIHHMKPTKTIFGSRVSYPTLLFLVPILSKLIKKCWCYIKTMLVNLAGISQNSQWVVVWKQWKNIPGFHAFSKEKMWTWELWPLLDMCLPKPILNWNQWHQQ